MLSRLVRMKLAGDTIRYVTVIGRCFVPLHMFGNGVYKTLLKMWMYVTLVVPSYHRAR